MPRRVWLWSKFSSRWEDQEQCERQGCSSSSIGNRRSRRGSGITPDEIENTTSKLVVDDKMEKTGMTVESGRARSVRRNIDRDGVRASANKNDGVMNMMRMCYFLVLIHVCSFIRMGECFSVVVGDRVLHRYRLENEHSYSVLSKMFFARENCDDDKNDMNTDSEQIKKPEPILYDDFDDNDQIGVGDDVGGEVIEDLNWRAEKLRLEEANTRRFLKAGPRFLPYEECRKWVQAWNRWETKQDWECWIDDGEKRNPYIPARPDEYYGRLGKWQGWDHFLGQEEDGDSEA